MAFMPQHERDTWTRGQQIKAQHMDSVQRIRARRDLSDQGRRRQLAAVTKTARDKLAALDAEDRQRLADRHNHLEEQLFRPTDTSPMGRTHALTCATTAAQISTPQQAERLMLQARRLGDSTLAQATARACVDLAGGDGVLAAPYWKVVHEWADQVPFARDRLEELGYADAEALDAHSTLSRSAHYRPGTVDELRGANLDVLAAQADESTDVRPPTNAERVGAQLAARMHAEIE